MQRSDWEYTKPKGFSIVTQFDLRCDQQWVVDLTRSVAFIGWGIGAVVLGWLGDKYGRKKLLLPSIVTTLFISLITPFIPNLFFLVSIRFFSCFFIPGATLQSFILISEVVGLKNRALAGILIYMTVPFGFCILTPKAYLITEWKYLCIVCSAPYLLVLVFYNFIPESIEWLRANGRVDEVMETVQRIARWNNTVLSSNMRVSLPLRENEAHSSSVLDIFRTKRLATCSIVIGYIWLTTGLGYYGLFLAADDLGGSEYLDFFIMSITELPATFAAIYLCEKLGRKRGTLFTTSTGSIMLLAVAPFPTTGTLLMIRITFGMIGKFMLSVTFNCIYLWSIELYPTKLRAKGMGWLQINTRLGSSLAPWISEWLSPFGKGTPFLAMGIPVLIGVGMGFVLPETQKEKAKSQESSTVIANTEIDGHSDSKV